MYWTLYPYFESISFGVAKRFDDFDYARESRSHSIKVYRRRDRNSQLLISIYWAWFIMHYEGGIVYPFFFHKAIRPLWYVLISRQSPYDAFLLYIKDISILHSHTVKLKNYIEIYENWQKNPYFSFVCQAGNNSNRAMEAVECAELWVQELAQTRTTRTYHWVVRRHLRQVFHHRLRIINKLRLLAL